MHALTSVDTVWRRLLTRGVPPTHWIILALLVSLLLLMIVSNTL